MLQERSVVVDVCRSRIRNRSWRSPLAQSAGHSPSRARGNPRCPRELPAAAPAELRGGTLDAARPWIDPCYRADSVEAVLTALHGRLEPVAAEAAAEIEARSPTALKVSLEALRRAQNMTVEECLDQVFRVSCTFLEEHDLPEGIRAVVVDKDHEPCWEPSRLGAVSRAAVERHFAPREGLAGIDPA